MSKCHLLGVAEGPLPHCPVTTLTHLALLIQRVCLALETGNPGGQGPDLAGFPALSEGG